jgi:hypothetical protein
MIKGLLKKLHLSKQMDKQTNVKDENDVSDIVKEF